jgi:hypothetical protein
VDVDDLVVDRGRVRDDIQFDRGTDAFFSLEPVMMKNNKLMVKMESKYWK